MKKQICIFPEKELYCYFSSIFPEVLQFISKEELNKKIRYFFSRLINVSDTFSFKKTRKLTQKKEKRSKSVKNQKCKSKMKGIYDFLFAKYFNFNEFYYIKKFKKEHNKYKKFLKILQEISLIITVSKIIKKNKNSIEEFDPKTPSSIDQNIQYSSYLKSIKNEKKKPNQIFLKRQIKAHFFYIRFLFFSHFISNNLKFSPFKYFFLWIKQRQYQFEELILNFYKNEDSQKRYYICYLRREDSNQEFFNNVSKKYRNKRSKKVMINRFEKESEYINYSESNRYEIFIEEYIKNKKGIEKKVFQKNLKILLNLYKTAKKNEYTKGKITKKKVINICKEWIKNIQQKLDIV